MKTTIKTIAVILGLAFSTASYASGDDKTTTKPVSYEVGAYISNDSKIRVGIKKDFGKRLSVYLKDANGNVIFEENLGKKRANYAVKLNLTELQDGEYSLEVLSGNELFKKKININSRKIERTVVLH